MPRRTPETLADYVVVALCPTLIGLMVGSLMWFLTEVFLGGEFVVLWVMSFFVLGIVGVSRLSIEEGYHKASLFGAVLAAALGFVLPMKAWPLLALVWWAVHKLTWDCTLIDDTQDASGEGLLQTMGLDPSASTASNVPPGTTMTADELEATSSKEAPPEKPWWDKLFEPDRRPHAPGVWVVYFSLAALPLFGIGGWFVTDASTRAAVFGLLVIYVSCGMGLLLSTSFLGLRRYLRQRRLQMPMEMTTTWILVGIVMIFAMLIVATILPRPHREQSLSQLPFTVASAARRASQWAVRKDGVRDDAAKNVATTEAKENQKTDRQGGNKQGKSGSQQANFSGQQQQSTGKGSSGGNGEKGQGSGGSGKSPSSGGGDKGKSGKSSSGGSQGDKAQGQNAEANSDQKRVQDSQQNNDQQSSQSAEQQKQNSGQNAQRQPPQPQSQSPSQPSSRPSFNPLFLLSSLLGAGIQWLFYAALVIGLVIAAWYYRDEVKAAWLKLMDELRDLWESWFGKKQVADETAMPTEVIAPPRTFASFHDPFLTGDARRMTWPQLVRYTFEALEAWGREHGCPRAIGQTPHEFALALTGIAPEIGSNVQALGGWYSQIAYAPKAATGSPDALRQLWHDLGARQSQPTAA